MPTCPDGWNPSTEPPQPNMPICDDQLPSKDTVCQTSSCPRPPTTACQVCQPGPTPAPPAPAPAPTPAPTSQKVGYWDCHSDPGCCRNTSGTDPAYGPIPKDSNLSIYFTGGTGANDAKNPDSIPQCKPPGGGECWFNFGGGANGKGKLNPIEVRDYYNGKPQTALVKLMTALKAKGYSGVTFDYENTTTDPASKAATMEDWKGLVDYVHSQHTLHGKTMIAALTMDKAGLAVTDTTFGFPQTADGKPDLEAAKTQFLPAVVPFDYNIPQLYGGVSLFYTGDLTDNPEKFPGFFTSCTVDSEEKYCKQPVQLLCDNLNSATKLIPSIGGTPPLNGLKGIKHMCRDKYDGKSFISWNITDPNAKEGCGNSCCGAPKRNDRCGMTFADAKTGKPCQGANSDCSDFTPGPQTCFDMGPLSPSPPATGMCKHDSPNSCQPCSLESDCGNTDKTKVDCQKVKDPKCSAPAPPTAPTAPPTAPPTVPTAPPTSPTAPPTAPTAPPAPTPAPPATKTPVYGWFDCPGDVTSCCSKPVPNPPAQQNIRIYFTGDSGANMPLPPNSTCASGDQCWINFGGGYGGTPAINHPINLRKYYKCTTSDADCASGSTKYVTDELKKVLALKGYTGVTFDYESADADPPSIEEWKGIVQVFKKNKWKTALTMGRVGLGTDVKPFGFPQTADGTPEDSDVVLKEFLPALVPFDYNLPQLYGGWPLFYTGEKNPSWETWTGSTADHTATPAILAGKGCFFDACPKTTNGADNGKCGGGAAAPAYCSKPLELLCQPGYVHDDTQIIPVIGGRSPVGHLAGIQNLCGKDKYDGESFISWNIIQPNQDKKPGNSASCS